MKKLIFPILIFIFFIFLFLSDSKKIEVYNHTDKKIIKIDFEEYIEGVVSAEMPASFNQEALMAQAVAARTYTLQKIRASNDDPYHNGADICTDSTHCQGFKSVSGIHKEKIKKAVSDTKGQVMLFDGEPIRAVYHSVSSGYTENSSDVWGGDVPYLKSTESPWDSACPYYSSTAAFYIDDICNALDIDKSSPYIENIIRSEAGGVKEIVICGQVIKGSDLRKALNLRSTCFTPEQRGDIIIFNVKGYGHGVGMSQWGAQGMADAGYKYTDILKHYYKNIIIEKITY